MKTPIEQAVRDAVINMAWANSREKRGDLLGVVSERLDALMEEHQRALAAARARGLEEAARIVESNSPESEVKASDARELDAARMSHSTGRSLAFIIRARKEKPEPPGMDTEPPFVPCSVCGEAHPDGSAVGGIP